MRSSYTLIVPDSARTRVLIVPGEQHWTLPELTFEQPYFWQVVGQINAAVRERFSLEVTTLRCRCIVHDAVRAQTRLVYELERHGAGEPLAVGGRWIGVDALNGLPAEQCTILASWFDEAHHSPPVMSRVPWYRPGWRNEMLTWLDAALNQVGYTRSAPVEQVRSWERSALWRATTDHGLVYFKAVPPMFGHEPALTALLAERFPTLVPPVLAMDSTRGWLVMADAGSQPLVEHPVIERWEAALRDYARIQVALANRIDDVRAVGVPDRGMGWLRAGLERLLADSDALARGPAGLTPDEIAALHTREPELRAACTGWEHTRLPVSLEHGDFSAWQVQIDGDNHRFLDWSDSAVAPPFFSMLGILGDIEAALPDIPSAAARLRDAYLDPWRELATLEVLREVFAVAQRLAPLHHALMYDVDILPAMEQRWEMEQMLPYYLRMLLA